MALGKPVFTRKNGSQKGGRLYKWSPVKENKKANPIKGAVNNFYCNASPRSRGEDWKVTYMYEIVVEAGVQKRIAYVACDYVA